MIGQSLVVWAIREGRDCAAAVDRFLTSDGRVPRDAARGVGQIGSVTSAEQALAPGGALEGVAPPVPPPAGQQQARPRVTA